MSVRELSDTTDVVVTLPCGGLEKLRQIATNAHVRRAVITLFEQSVLSATNFLTTVIIGRTCLQQELGLYSMGFSLVMILIGMSCALVWMPYTVNCAHLRGSRLQRYTGSVTVHMGLFCLLTGVGLAVAAVVTASSPANPALSGLLAVLIFAAVSMLFREYVRRVYLAQLHAGRSLVLNLALAGLQLGGLAVLVSQDMLSARAAFGIIALAGGLLSAAWLFVERHRLRIRRRQVWSDWRHNWKSARWLFAATLIRLIAKDIYPWILAAFHGVSAVGILTAASGVIFFVNPLLMAVANYSAPFAAHTYAKKGMAGLDRAVRRGTLGLTAVMSLFCLLVWIWGGEFVQLLYGPQYAGTDQIVRAVALWKLAEAACIPVGFALLAVHRADYELKTALVQLAVMVTLGLWCVQRFGPAGVGIGAAAGSLAAVAVMWFAFRRIVRHA